VKVKRQDITNMLAIQEDIRDILNSIFCCYFRRAV